MIGKKPGRTWLTLPVVATPWEDEITTMIVLIGIAMILLLLRCWSRPRTPHKSPGWTGFVIGPSTQSTDCDKVRVASDLQVLR